jgi:hypothetical protein
MARRRLKDRLCLSPTLVAMLPGVEQAVVELAKIHDYLLSPSHPVGRFKAVVFFSLGYTTEGWVKLRDDILTLARAEEARPGQHSEYGQKYEVSGTLQGPNGRARSITTVWLVPVGDYRPKFITAFPG